MMDDQVLVTGALAAAQVLESHRDSSNLSHLAANMSIAAINSVSGERPTTDVLTFWQEGAKQQQQCKPSRHVGLALQAEPQAAYIAIAGACT